MCYAVIVNVVDVVWPKLEALKLIKLLSCDC